MVVDLPAPLGPKKPNTSPLTTLRSMPVTAAIARKFFVRPDISIMELDAVCDTRWRAGSLGKSTLSRKGLKPGEDLKPLHACANRGPSRGSEPAGKNAGPEKGPSRKDPEWFRILGSACAGAS